MTVAVLVALAVLVTRGYRLDWPQDMYFDEVYHARTAFELLAQREPYEWTHPHLAKEIMALGILAFGDDRVVGHEAVPSDTVMAAVGNDGLRVYALADGTIEIAERGSSPQSVTQLLGPPRGMAVDGDRIFAVTDEEIDEIDLTPSLRATPPGHVSFSKVRAREAEPRVTSFAVSGDRVLVGTARSLAIYTTLDAAPVVIAIPTVAVTAKTDGSEVYALDPQGIVHVISADTGQETRALTGGRPGTAIAYALGPNRLFVARADAASLDVYELETGSHDSVPLANARTGTFSSAASALAVVPRTDFLYALDEGHVVVVETHGTSPFASIPVTGSMLGVDGEGDKLSMWRRSLSPAGTSSSPRIGRDARRFSTS